MSDSENPNAVPLAILKKHPEMLRVFSALEQYRQGVEVVENCLICGLPLKVADLPEIGVLTVECATGCTKYRQRYTPKSVTGDD